MKKTLVMTVAAVCISPKTYLNSIVESVHVRIVTELPFIDTEK